MSRDLIKKEFYWENYCLFSGLIVSSPFVPVSINSFQCEDYLSYFKALEKKHPLFVLNLCNFQ